MRVQIFKYWNRIRSSFWFVPAIMVVVAMALVSVSVAVNEPVTEWFDLNLGWTFTGEAEAASAVMATIAGSMVTIAGVVFSMTLVALSLASSQLGPRLLRTFMRDTSTQVVLGTFIATFVYCLLVLRTIRHADGSEFVPNVSVTLGVVFAVASVGVLIYFIHHVSVSIQANEIARRTGKELIEKIDSLFPENIGQEPPALTTDSREAEVIGVFDRDARPVAAIADGYLQSFDGEVLLTLATKEDLIVRLERKPGNYVVTDSPLVSISPGSRVSEKLSKYVQSLFVVGDQRTTDQDIEFAVNQLVEMAVRALSPGLNDPFTAIACVDHLGSALCRLAAREMPSPYRYDRHNQLRLIARADTFGEVVDTSFNQIRQYGRSSAAVTIRLLETIAVIARFAYRPEDRATLLRHAEMILRGAREGLPEVEDRKQVEKYWQETEHHLFRDQ